MKINEQTKAFIEIHRKEDVNDLALKTKKTEGLDLPFALSQIEGWQKAVKKIPSWAVNDNILYPPHLSMEQCSSQLTALNKQSIMKDMEGAKDSFADLTGGFGIDCCFIGQIFRQCHYVERQEILCNLARHNFNALELKSIEVHQDDAQDFLQQSIHFDWIYMDPARRDSHGGKMTALEDCVPNVLELKELLLAKADYVMLKLSPMLDIKQALTALGTSVKEVHVVSVDNECKELLFVLHGLTNETSIKIHTINLSSNSKEPQLFTFTSDDEKLPCTYAERFKTYLYEPNASVLKAGAFKSIARLYKLEKLHPSSHLYTSDQLEEAFPGRIFHIQGYTLFNMKSLILFLKDIRQANLTVRNFPQSVAELRKKLKLNEGGDTYLFATTLLHEEKVLIHCFLINKSIPL